MQQERPKILVVDDEEDICFVLQVNLRLAGYDVDTALSAEQALGLPLEQYDLFLLDVMMEASDGFTLAHEIRQREGCADAPIIFCTARDDEESLLTGFEHGADDYIKKPFSMKELLARVQSVLKRTKGHVGERLTMGGVTLNFADRTCTVEDQPLNLTRTEFDLLAFLMRHAGTMFTREQLLESVWRDDVYVIDRTIDVNINRLRKKLGRFGINLRTKQGYGYGYEAII